MGLGVPRAAAALGDTLYLLVTGLACTATLLFLGDLFVPRAAVLRAKPGRRVASFSLAPALGLALSSFYYASLFLVFFSIFAFPPDFFEC